MMFQTPLFANFKKKIRLILPKKFFTPEFVSTRKYILLNNTVRILSCVKILQIWRGWELRVQKGYVKWVKVIRG